MNKNLIAHMVAGVLLLGTSVASMAATNQVGTHQQNLALTVTSGTCNVTWPTDVNFSITSADTNTTGGAKIGDTKDAGSFVLTGCPANTLMKFSVKAANVAQGNVYQGLFTDTSGQAIHSIGYRLSTAGDFSSTWNLSGKEGNLGTTNAAGELTVGPVYVGLVKRGNGVSSASGDLSSVVTYTISYN
ncbi:hypothetical protein V8I75_002085 [Escherichia coli]